MRNLLKRVCLIMSTSITPASAVEAQHFEINTELMQSTFQVTGPAVVPNSISGGTAFVLG